MRIRGSLVPRVWWPSDILGEMQRVMRPLEETFSGTLAQKMTPRSAELGGAWLPRAEVHQTEDALEVSFEIPGVARDDIEVETTVEGVRVHGERKVAKAPCPEEGCCASEFVYGVFDRYMDWPVPVVHNEAKATMENGVLKITVPLAEEARPPEAHKVTVE